MKKQKTTSRFFSIWQRKQRYTHAEFLREAIPYVSVLPENIQTLSSPTDYRETLLRLIAQAKRRIVIVALYLQNDEAGEEILSVLHEAKRARPELDVMVFVDWHRAQRALIGKEKSAGNSAMYVEMAKAFDSGVKVYGVPVQRREFMGVLHLKGYIIDDDVLYSG
ncbi:MAG: hypothetical protein ACRCWR_01445, partial [Saezia sp.]